MFDLERLLNKMYYRKSQTISKKLKIVDRIILTSNSLHIFKTVRKNKMEGGEEKLNRLTYIE